MYYMGRHKPRLCRMKRLDVFHKLHFLLKMIQFMLFPSHSTFLLAEKIDIFTSVISVFIRQ